MKISIITVCYNNPSELSLTLKSISESIIQTDGVEVIVIDGSNDEACKIVVKNFDDINITSLHEPDDGIYNAMNKGLGLAQGKSILFLNSGDVLHKDFVFKDFIHKYDLYLEEKIIFGDVEHKVGGFINLKRMNNYILEEKWWLNTLPSHQSIFIPSVFFKINKFDESLTISADTKLCRNAFNKYEYIYYPLPIARFELGGVSNNPKTLKHVHRLYLEVVLTTDMTAISKLSLYLSLVRRMLLIRVFGMERYYRLVCAIKKLSLKI